MWVDTLYIFVAWTFKIYGTGNQFLNQFLN